MRERTRSQHLASDATHRKLELASKNDLERGTNSLISNLVAKGFMDL